MALVDEGLGELGVGPAGAGGLGDLGAGVGVGFDDPLHAAQDLREGFDGFAAGTPGVATTPGASGDGGTLGTPGSYDVDAMFRD